LFILTTMQNSAATAFRSLNMMRRQQSTFANLVGGRAMSTSATFKLPEIIGTHKLDVSLLPTESTITKTELRALFD